MMVIRTQGGCFAKRFKSLEFREATKEEIEIRCLIQLVVQMVDLQDQIWLEIFQNLARNVLFRAMYTYHCSLDIFSIERKIVPEHVEPVGILGRSKDA